MNLNQPPFLIAMLNPLLSVRTLWKHRNLLWQFTLRNVEMRHRGSVLGVAWSVINPLLMLALYVFVFGFVFGGTFGVLADESRLDYGLGMFLGLAIFHLVAETISVAPSVIVNNPNFVKKVVFPLEILPAAAVGAAIIHMLITLLMVFLCLILTGRTPKIAIVMLPLVLFPTVAFALGLAWFIAAVGVFFRDIGQLVNALVTGLMFASAIFYPASRIQTQAPNAWSILKFNPLLQSVEMSRDLVLWDKSISLTTLLWMIVGTGLCATVGFACFARLKPAFADVI